MKKIILNIIIIASLCFSCERDLDLAPVTEVSETTFFKKASDFEEFANQYYGSLSGFGTPGLDRQSDIMFGLGTNNISNGSYVTSEESGFWNGSYDRIRQTTFLLQKYDALEDASLKTEAVIYAAEARFFRAYAYFNLVKNYGGVPLITQILNTTDTEILFKARNSREEVITQVLTDLDAAISDLPEQSSYEGGNSDGRITKGAALSFKAKVALFEGTWRKYHGGSVGNLLDQAIAASNAVISSNEYEIFNHTADFGGSAIDNYKYFFILEQANKTNAANLTKNDNKEFIIERRFDRGREVGGGIADPRGFSPTSKLANMYLCTDGLPIDKSPLFQGYDLVGDEYINRDSRMAGIMMVPFEQQWSYRQTVWQRDWSDPMANGFTNTIEIPGRTTTGYTLHKLHPEIIGPNGVDYPVLRYAEVLLIFAEATFEKDGSISDADLNKSINVLRDRAGIANLTNALVTNNGLDMLTEIRRERTIELAMEGLRYDDLRRWKTAEIELPKAITGIKYAGTQFETDAPWNTLSVTLDADGFMIVDDVSARSFDANKHYLQPLPTNQVELTEMEQNPGWN
ncbi:RagB/SusD family nutrient uptake outer membrane protein [Flavivirga spongiicola]|uniref:RagB/SusD family nutrient uptake outer membrane protein n=1 Tax=Flavivirga spongiicola TaxID=421621 RepID=A0ABU7XW51_9FLAO|nr:RagB/SusD family nutrient uptake outer membrane protein [Flavivirga sp. MEBiC05379]MDO5979083.1 RagB/SusD family nutrient uptake outer membrane protein [Flavivirga sp. MEBiC05379]